MSEIPEQLGQEPTRQLEGMGTPMSPEQTQPAALHDVARGAGGVAVGEQAEQVPGGRHARLFNPDPALDDVPVDVERAAVRGYPHEAPEPAVAGGTFFRTGYWKAATTGQIASAGQRGVDLAAANSKYYPYSGSRQ